MTCCLFNNTCTFTQSSVGVAAENRNRCTRIAEQTTSHGSHERIDKINRACRMFRSYSRLRLTADGAVACDRKPSGSSLRRGLTPVTRRTAPKMPEAPVSVALLSVREISTRDVLRTTLTICVITCWLSKRSRPRRLCIICLTCVINALLVLRGRFQHAPSRRSRVTRLQIILPVIILPLRWR
jgi:hypothetical protein